MKSNTTPTDIQSLTNDFYPTAYSLQLQAEELAAADDFEGYTDWSQRTLKPSGWQKKKPKHGMAQSLSLLMTARKCSSRRLANMPNARITNAPARTFVLAVSIFDLLNVQ